MGEWGELCGQALQTFFELVTGIHIVVSCARTGGEDGLEEEGACFMVDLEWVAVVGRYRRCHWCGCAVRSGEGRGLRRCDLGRDGYHGRSRIGEGKANRRMGRGRRRHGVIVEQEIAAGEAQRTETPETQRRTELLGLRVGLMHGHV